MNFRILIPEYRQIEMEIDADNEDAAREEAWERLLDCEPRKYVAIEFDEDVNNWAITNMEK